MAFNNIDQLDLGTLLQIIFSDNVRNQISEDYRDWENVLMSREGNSLAREYRFQFSTDYGPGAVQYRDPGTSNRSFPDAQQSSISENIAKFKEINTTIDLEYNLWERAQQSPETYAKPLEFEIQNKTIASKRRMAADYYGDGSGVVGKSDGVPAISAGRLVVSVKTGNADRGHVGFFEFGDKLLHYAEDSTAGAAPTVASGTFAYWKVESKDRDQDEVTLSARDAAGAELTVTVAGVADDDHFYRSGQPTIPDLTAPIADYGTLTEVIAGLESLTAADGRTIHGIGMSGASAGTRRDAGGNVLDVSDIQKVMSLTKTIAGQGKYNWKMMCMSPEAHDTLIESRETDRRFQTVQDNKRGTSYFAYVHNNDTIETYTSEYCPKNRLYIKPENKSSSGKVLEYRGTDFSTVKAPGGSDFHLKPGAAGGHVNNVVSYLQAFGVLVCNHPAAIAVIENFKVS